MSVGGLSGLWYVCSECKRLHEDGKLNACSQDRHEEVMPIMVQR